MLRRPAAPPPSSPPAASAGWLLLAAALLGAGAASTSACTRAEAPAPAPAPAKPTLRLQVLGTIAGAIEPCGCQKAMLGGVDHAAAILRARAGEAPSLTVGAGPMLFMDPTLDARSRQQALWKAEAMADALAGFGLSAWAPGLNDWAGGAAFLAEQRERARATLLAGNLGGATAGAVPTRIAEVGGVKVGLAGVSDPARLGLRPEGVTSTPAREALVAARDRLRTEGAGLLVALVALPRGEALRLAETVEGFHVMVVGKPFDRGEGNDAPTPPVRLGTTLVVEPPNHLQGITLIDVFLRDGSFELADGSGLAQAERRTTLETRIDELSRRIAQWEAGGKVNREDLDARRADLAKARAELGALPAPSTPAQGSFFKVELALVRDSAGTDPEATARLAAYYQRVNEHNKVAFADRRPEPVAAGKSGFVGVEACGKCHAEEVAFWKGTGHSRAYATLTRQHKEFNLDCVSCHVTGYDEPGGSTVTHVERLTDVQCEACHGPGSRHPEAPSSDEFIVKKPAQDLCGPRCHHPPHVAADWNAQAAWRHILGPGHGG